MSGKKENMRLGNGFKFSRLVGYQMYGMNMNEYKSKWSTQVEYIGESGKSEIFSLWLSQLRNSQIFTELKEKTNKQNKCNFESGLNCWCISP